MANIDRDPTMAVPGAETRAETGIDLSIGGIKQAAEALKVKVEAARLQKQQDIGAKLTEHDQVMAEILNTDRLMAEATEVKDYFLSVKEAGELPSDEEVTLQGILQTVEALQQQRSDLERKAEAIYHIKDVGDAMQERAEKDRINEVNSEKIKKSVTELIVAISQTAERAYDVALRYAAAEKKVAEFRAQIRKLAGTALDLPQVRGRIHEENLEDWRRVRESLGFRQGREKGLIDHVINHPEAFEQLAAANTEYEQASKEQGELYNDASWGETFKAIQKESDALHLNTWGNVSHPVNEFVNSIRKELQKKGRSDERAADFARNVVLSNFRNLK